MLHGSQRKLNYAGHWSECSIRLVVSKTSKQFGRFQIYGNRVVGQYALFVN